MAFNSNARAPGSNVVGIPEDKKATGFINIYLPTKKTDGKRKLVGIPLLASDPNHKQLIDLIESNPKEGLQKIADNMIVEYQSATRSEDSAFDL